MNWPLLSLRVGTVRPFGPSRQPSAIHKQAVAQAVYLDYSGLQTDQQGDPHHHGGPEKALHHYASEHYAVWMSELAEADSLLNMQPGGFGENISTLGLTEKNVSIGDIFTLGRAVIQVSQPRQPCWKLSVRFNVPGMALKVQTSGRTGWYYRVLEPGLVSPDEVLRRVEQINPSWTLARVLTVLYQDRLNADELAGLSELPALTKKMQMLAATRLSRLAVEDWTPRLNGSV